ncbi:MAG: flagellar hook-associated protein FlgK [Motiliproteus sp.]|nr:flagellar hook-associated protein FlgK [Motiliproteus sp.]MCW9051991.1 flagellar hook-associated protein FlgK [Motiliproteus sp.]
MAGLLNIGVQALNVNQAALDITGQNIANVNTVGYTRQAVELNSRAVPELGVKLDDISRVADQFATRQLWVDTAKASSSEIFEAQANQLDNLLADSSTSISSAMDDFFGALQSGVDDPSSISSRQVVLSQAESLVRRFQDLDHQLEQQNALISSQITALSSRVTELSAQVADLNQKVSFAVARQEPANELKDQREEIVRQLSEIIGVSVQSSGEDGDINLFVGNGQPLVIGNQASSVGVLNGDPDPDKLRVMVTVAGRSIEVGGDITTGQIGGMLTYRDEVLIPAWNELGRLAITFSESMNEQHLKGVDLNGDMGVNLFDDLKQTGIVSAYTGNETGTTVNPSVLITDTSLLQASDYTITFTDTDDFLIIRESDGEQFHLGSDISFDSGASVPLAANTYWADFPNGDIRVNIDGFEVTLNGEIEFQQGDKFLVQPVRSGGELLELAIGDGELLAFASPIRATADSDNSGSAVIDSVTVTESGNATFTTTAGAMSPPVEIVFNNTDPATFDVLDTTDPNNPVPYLLNGTTALSGQSYTSGDSIQLNGFSVTLKGVPTPGDRYTFDYNTDGVGDNQNALALSDLQIAATTDGASYQDIYSQLVESVGTRASVAQITAAADQTVLKNSTSVRDSVSGVNLDEEAANIIKFQQAYQAAAQLIETSRTLFDTLLNASRG